MVRAGIRIDYRVDFIFVLPMHIKTESHNRLFFHKRNKPTVNSYFYMTRPTACCESRWRANVASGKDATVFQAEVATIHHCVQEVNRQSSTKCTIAIRSDSQATLKALNFV